MEDGPFVAIVYNNDVISQNMRPDRDPMIWDAKTVHPRDEVKDEFVAQ